MLTDIARVLGQLPEPRLLKPVLLGFLVSALVLAGLVAASFWVLIEWLPPVDDSWFGDLLASVGLLEIGGTVLVAWFALMLFPAVALTVQGLFLDSVCDAVEGKHYPTLGPARDVPIGEALSAALKLTGVVLLVNILLLPIYLLLMLLPPTGFLLYLAVNGYLVGREYFEQVALRREAAKEAKATRRRHRMSLWLDGVLMVLVLSLPVVNLAGPTLGTAYMVHRFHRLKGTPRGRQGQASAVLSG